MRFGEGMGSGSCCNLNAYVSFWEALESSVDSVASVELASFRGRFQASNPAAGSSKYLCLCFIYLHCQNQFCPRVQLFFTFMPRAPPHAPTFMPRPGCLSATCMQKASESVVCFQLKTFRVASRGPTNSVSVPWVTPSA